VNLKDLKYVVAVAETGHFGKAAEKCFVSQPTLSGQIRKLEQELGVVIFERTNRSVKITQVGQEILEHARQMLEQADSIKQIAQARKDPMAGPLRLGVIPTLSPYLMPLVLAPLKRSYPALRLVLSEEMTESLLDRLHNHELDAALLATPVNDADLDCLPLFDEPFWVAYPPSHRFYHQQSISRKDLENSELLLLTEGHCLANQSLALCQLKTRQDTGEMADLRASSLETLIELVATGHGVTLIPALALRGGWITGRGVMAQALDLPDAYRRIRLVFRRSFPRRQALESLAGIIRGQLPNTVTPLSANN